MEHAAEPSAGSRVRPLDAVERRVLGVLIEKAKTTPDQYPLSLAALVTGSNQKSNRDPLMTVDEDSVGRALESLRECGVVSEIFGSGRVPRYRHHAYEWFAAGKEEVSILAELLLRGEQSEGDLRGRASRMDPIADLATLRTHLDNLAARGLVVWLSPPGRGRMLTHGLLPPEKLEKVRAKLGMEMEAATAAGEAPDAVESAAAHPHSRSLQGPAPDAFAELVRRVELLECEVAELKQQVRTAPQA